MAKGIKRRKIERETVDMGDHYKVRLSGVRGTYDILVDKEDIHFIDDALTVRAFNACEGANKKMKSKLEKYYVQLLTKDGKKLKSRYLHQAVLGHTGGREKVPHHINCNGLDNRKSNLVLLSRAEHREAERRDGASKYGSRYGITGEEYLARIDEGRCVECGVNRSETAGYFRCGKCQVKSRTKKEYEAIGPMRLAVKYGLDIEEYQQLRADKKCVRCRSNWDGATALCRKCRRKDKQRVAAVLKDIQTQADLRIQKKEEIKSAGRRKCNCCGERYLETSDYFMRVGGKWNPTCLYCWNNIFLKWENSSVGIGRNV